MRQIMSPWSGGRPMQCIWNDNGLMISSHDNFNFQTWILRFTSTNYRTFFLFFFFEKVRRGSYCALKYRICNKKWVCDICLIYPIYELMIFTRFHYSVWNERYLWTDIDCTSDVGSRMSLFLHHIIREYFVCRFAIW